MNYPNDSVKIFCKLGSCLFSFYLCFRCFFSCFLFNVKKIFLQYYVGFCHRTMQISHNYAYITSLLSLPPVPPSHPSRSSQSTKLSSLCCTAVSHWLSTLHMVVYMLLLNSTALRTKSTFPLS